MLYNSPERRQNEARSRAADWRHPYMPKNSSFQQKHNHNQYPIGNGRNAGHAPKTHSDSPGLFHSHRWPHSSSYIVDVLLSDSSSNQCATGGPVPDRAINMWKSNVNVKSEPSSPGTKSHEHRPGYQTCYEEPHISGNRAACTVRGFSCVDEPNDSPRITVGIQPYSNACVNGNSLSIPPRNSATTAIPPYSSPSGGGISERIRAAAAAAAEFPSSLSTTTLTTTNSANAVDATCARGFFQNKQPHLTLSFTSTPSVSAPTEPCRIRWPESCLSVSSSSSFRLGETVRFNVLDLRGDSQMCGSSYFATPPQESVVHSDGLSQSVLSEAHYNQNPSRIGRGISARHSVDQSAAPTYDSISNENADGTEVRNLDLHQRSRMPSHSRRNATFVFETSASPVIPATNITTGTVAAPRKEASNAAVKAVVPNLNSISQSFPPIKLPVVPASLVRAEQRRLPPEKGAIFLRPHQAAVAPTMPPLCFRCARAFEAVALCKPTKGETAKALGHNEQRRFEQKFRNFVVRKVSNGFSHRNGQTTESRAPLNDLFALSSPSRMKTCCVTRIADTSVEELPVSISGHGERGGGSNQCICDLYVAYIGMQIVSCFAKLCFNELWTFIFDVMAIMAMMYGYLDERRPSYMLAAGVTLSCTLVALAGMLLRAQREAEIKPSPLTILSIVYASLALSFVLFNCWLALRLPLANRRHFCHEKSFRKDRQLRPDGNLIQQPLKRLQKINP